MSTACELVHERWHKRGAEAARRDLQSGVHRRLYSGLPEADYQLRVAYVWDHYGVEYYSIAGCLPGAEHRGYIDGYASVAQDIVDARIPPEAQIHAALDEYRACRDPWTIRPRAALPPPLDPPPPAY